MLSDKELLQSVFGPEGWAARAARSLGCTPRFVNMVAQGFRTMPRRHRVILRNVAQFRMSDLARECKQEQAAVAEKYAKARERLRRAQAVLEKKS